MTALFPDVEIAEEIRRETLIGEVVVDNENKFYKDFLEAIEVPKSWEDKIVLSDTQTEFFCYKAKLYCDTHNHSINIITYKEDGMLKFAVVFRDLLIDLYRTIDFYQDINLNYFLQTVNPKTLSIWKYVNLSS